MYCLKFRQMLTTAVQFPGRADCTCPPYALFLRSCMNIPADLTDLPGYFGRHVVISTPTGLCKIVAFPCSNRRFPLQFRAKTPRFHCKPARLIPARRTRSTPIYCASLPRWGFYLAALSLGGAIPAPVAQTGLGAFDRTLHPGHPARKRRRKPWTSNCPRKTPNSSK